MRLGMDAHHTVVVRIEMQFLARFTADFGTEEATGIGSSENLNFAFFSGEHAEALWLTAHPRSRLSKLSVEVRTR